MDFHAVVESAVDDQWQVWDAIRPAPRHSLVRVSTGRDAADTAFATVLSGQAEAFIGGSRPASDDDTRVLDEDGGVVVVSRRNDHSTHG